MGIVLFGSIIDIYPYATSSEESDALVIPKQVAFELDIFLHLFL